MLKTTVATMLVAGVTCVSAQGAPTLSSRAQLPVAPFATESTNASASKGLANADARWEIRASDVTLAKTFERWASAAGHKVKWDASRNFLVGASDTYVGTFEGALMHVLSSPGIRYSDYPLEACIYANNPPLVRITRQGEQSRECAASTPQ